MAPISRGCWRNRRLQDEAGCQVLSGAASLPARHISRGLPWKLERQLSHRQTEPLPGFAKSFCRALEPFILSAVPQPLGSAALPTWSAVCCLFPLLRRQPQRWKNSLPVHHSLVLLPRWPESRSPHRKHPCRTFHIRERFVRCIGLFMGAWEAGMV